MRKSLKIIILLVVAILSVCCLFACDSGKKDADKPGLYVKKLMNDNYYTVYKYVAEEGVTSLDIAEKAVDESGNKVTVGRIMANAFSGNESLTKLIVPQSVEVIDKGAFAGMKKIEEIELPFIGTNKNGDRSYNYTGEDEDKAVNEERTFGYMFGEEEYSGGSLFTQVYMSGTEDKTINSYIPKSLTKITVNPKEEYAIPMYAFAGNGSNWNFVKEVSFSDKVVAIGDSAFKNAKALDTLTITKNITDIYKNAFDGCIALKKVTFEEGATLKNIGDSAFANSGLTEIVLPKKDTIALGKKAFANSKLVKAELNSVKKINESAFINCELLTKVVFADGVETIMSNAFESCVNLKTVGKEGTEEGKAVFTGITVENNAFAKVPQSNFSDIIDLPNKDYVFLAVK